MPRATCRCGQRLSFPADGPDRVICPKCQSRIRVRRPGEAAAAAAAASAPITSGSGDGDNFIRFNCPCGRRLKVRDSNPRPESGRCPECGRVVPVPAHLAPSPPPAGRSGGDPESPTVDMDAADLEALARWAESYQRKPRGAAAIGSDTPATPVAPLAARAVNGTHPAGLLDAPPAADAEEALELAPQPEPEAPPNVAALPIKIEAGLRVCPRCGRPVHLGAETCRQCGAHVPRR